MTVKKTIGIVVLFVLLFSITSAYYYYYVAPRNSGSCIGVLAPAHNIRTGECKIFSSPCEIPRMGWVEDNTCPIE